MSVSLAENIRALALENFEEIRAYRQHLHQHPELSFQEFETSKFIQEKLTAFGIEFIAPVAKTGVIGIIKGKNPNKKIIALRADMDALPIEELNNIPYKSQNPGVMHACGHDVHTSCLLGAAKILNALKDTFEGSIKLIFQPSEEKLPGGAKVMIAEGALKNPDVENIFAQHVFNPFETGKIAVCFGTMLASTDEIYITVKGKGGHGAYPHDTKDPVMMTAQMLVALQQVVSRVITPFEPAVLSFGKVIANGATNIIPDSVQVEGTFRALNEEVREKAHQTIKEIAEGVVHGLGGELDLQIVKGYPVLKNDEALTRRVYENAIQYLGKENVIITTPKMGAEDFSFYSQEIPACFYRLGTGNTHKGISSSLHAPTFNIDEDAITIGMGFMAFNAISELMHA